MLTGFDTREVEHAGTEFATRPVQRPRAKPIFTLVAEGRHAPYAGAMSAAHDEDQLGSAIDRLRENRLRVTEPRRAILGLMIGEHGPFSIDEIHRRLPEGRCDVVTVYRSVAAMEEAGLVRRCEFGDGVSRYEFDPGDHHHHHLICRRCNRVETLDLCVADTPERLAREKGYTHVSHVMEIFGVCPDCQNESK